MTTPDARTRPVWAVVTRILIPIGVFAAGVLVLMSLSRGDAASATLPLRIAGGAVLSALVIAVCLLLVRIDDGRPRDIGLTPPAPAARAFVAGLLAWSIPAAASVVALALLGSRFTVTASPAEFASVLGMLVVAVLLVEAVPEEVVFRGSVTRVLGERLRGWWVIVVQAALSTATAVLLHGGAGLADIALFVAMGIGLGYLRMLTGSVWTTIGFHLAFQTASKLVFAHDVVEFGGSGEAAALALGAVPFAVGAVLLAVIVPRHPRWFAAERTSATVSPR